jgi:hypothetical protein
LEKQNKTKHAAQNSLGGHLEEVEYELVTRNEDAKSPFTLFLWRPFNFFQSCQKNTANSLLWRKIIDIQTNFIFHIHKAFLSYFLKKKNK